MVFDELCYSHPPAVIRVRGLYIADTQRSRGREGGSMEERMKWGGRRRIESLQESEPGTRNKTSVKKKKIPSPPRSSQPGGEESFELSYENYSMRKHDSGASHMQPSVRNPLRAAPEHRSQGQWGAGASSRWVQAVERGGCPGSHAPWLKGYHLQTQVPTGPSLLPLEIVGSGLCFV